MLATVCGYFLFLTVIGCVRLGTAHCHRGGRMMARTYIDPNFEGVITIFLILTDNILMRTVTPRLAFSHEMVVHKSVLNTLI